MKRTFAAAFVAALSLSAAAQVSKPSERLTDGFYRVQNVGTGRYAYLSDKEGGALNLNTTAPDFGSMVLFNENSRDRFSDPSTVYYIKRVSHKHDVHSQNTSFHEMVGHYIQIQDYWKGRVWITDELLGYAYQITPLYAGTNYYLADGTGVSETKTTSYVRAIDQPNESYLNLKYCWNIAPVSSSTSEYLGIKSDECLQYNGKYYKPYVIGFNMTFVNPDTKAYYVSEVKEDAVIIKEISGLIPANTPIIVESTSALPSENRVDLSFPAVAAPTDNLLEGQYFCYGNHSESDHLAYDSETMRLLAVKDGQLKYITVPADDKYLTTVLEFENGDKPIEYVQCIKGNSSYLTVEPGAWDELPVMTEEEYQAAHNPVEKGDADGSGDVNLDDVKGDEGIVSMVLKQTEENVATSDLNNDGKVTIVDIVLLIKKLITKQ